MSFRSPTVLVELWDHTLRNGNVHRLQIVTWGAAGRGVAVLECREYVSPGNLDRHEPPCRHHHPESGWGVGYDKGLRIEHLEWLLENGAQVKAAMRRAKVMVLEEGLDGWGRPIR